VFVWIVGQLGTGIVGVILGLFLRTVLPDRQRDRVIYWGNRARKYWKNDDFDVSIAWKYASEESVPLDELKQSLQDEFSQAPTTHSNFEFKKQFPNNDITVKIRPNRDVDIGQAGGTNPGQGTTSSVLVTYKTNPSYRDLVDTLLNLQDADRKVGDKISAIGFARQSSSVTCDLPAKPTIQRLLGEGQLDTIRGKSSDGTRIDFSSGQLQIESSDSSSMTSTIKRAIVHYG